MHSLPNVTASLGIYLECVDSEIVWRKHYQTSTNNPCLSVYAVLIHEPRMFEHALTQTPSTSTELAHSAG